MTAELAQMVEANDRESKTVDPRWLPVRFSALKAFEQSPLHYWQACQNQQEETLAMRLGSGAHALLFDKPVVLWDQPAKKGEGKAPRNGKAWDDFCAEHADALILNRKEMADARAVADAVRRNDLAMSILADTVQEQQLTWSYRDRACRSTPDARSRLHLVEFKTTKCSEPIRFARDAQWRHYHAQVAYYVDAMTAAGVGTPQDSYIVAVESSPPHPVTVLRLTERSIAIGRRLYRTWFERLLACEAENRWEPYVTAITDLEITGDSLGESDFTDGL